MERDQPRGAGASATRERLHIDFSRAPASERSALADRSLPVRPCLVALQPVFLDLLDQGRPRDAELARRARSVRVVSAERPVDVNALHFRERAWDVMIHSLSR